MELARTLNGETSRRKKKNDARDAAEKCLQGHSAPNMRRGRAARGRFRQASEGEMMKRAYSHRPGPATACACARPSRLAGWRETAVCRSEEGGREGGRLAGREGLNPDQLRKPAAAPSRITAGPTRDTMTDRVVVQHPRAGQTHPRGEGQTPCWFSYWQLMQCSKHRFYSILTNC